MNFYTILQLLSLTFIMIFGFLALFLGLSIFNAEEDIE